MPRQAMVLCWLMRGSCALTTVLTTTLTTVAGAHDVTYKSNWSLMAW
jgi:hypothetical protein